MPYRILSIAPTSFFADYGCHVRILEEIRALQQLGHQVTLCTYHTGHPVPGIRIVRMPRLPWQRRVRVGSHWHKPYFDLLLTATALVTAVRQRVDVVHAHLHEGALIGAVVAKLLRCPLVFDYQGSLTGEMLDHGFLSARSPLLHLFARLEQGINGLADVVITSSAHAQAQLAATGRSDKPLFALTDAVDPSFFRPRPQNTPAAAALRTALGIPTGRQVVVFLGLLADYQGIPQLLHAAVQVVRHHPSTHFLIMGYPGLEQYRRLAYDLQLLDYVTFTGRVPYSRAPQYLSLGDVAVAPKLSETEGNGKILNYMAMGLPTVAFATAVARELLGPHGVYAPPGNPFALADRIAELLADPRRRRQLGALLRRRAGEEFSWRDGGRRLEALYAALLAGRPPPHIPSLSRGDGEGAG